MVKKVVRLFWSFDVIKTEKWLGEMAIQGYRLQKVNLITREFIFENDNSKTIHYRICRHKAGVSATSQTLISNQWYSAFSKGKWSILANESQASELKIYPSRESLYKRNRILKYSIGIPLAYYAFIMMIPIILIIVSLFSNTVSGHFEPGSKISITAMLLFISSLLYIFVRLNKSDKKLRMENGIYLTIPKSIILDSKTERALRKEGKLIKKRKSWIYAPDKVEEWLEDMEMKGYNLYRMSRAGTFYFMKGEPRTIKYCVDYQNFVNDSYFEIHKSNGWDMIFTNRSTLTKYTIWRKEYSDEKPELYSDKSHILKHARKQCMLYCTLYIPIIVMYISLTLLMIRMSSAGRPLFWPTPIMFALLIVEFGYFTIQSLGYYIRTRKRINNY